MSVRTASFSLYSVGRAVPWYHVIVRLCACRQCTVMCFHVSVHAGVVVALRVDCKLKFATIKAIHYHHYYNSRKCQYVQNRHCANRQTGISESLRTESMLEMKRMRTK